MCIAFGIPITAANAEISGYVQDSYQGGSRHWFTSTFDDWHEAGWEYYCENGFDDMELSFESIEILFDFDTEDERDGYSYVTGCEVVYRQCAPNYYIKDLYRDDGSFVENACSQCPAAPDGTRGKSSCNSWNEYDGISCSVKGITSCFITGGKDNTGTFKYTSNCYYKQ